MTSPAQIEPCEALAAELGGVEPDLGLFAGPADGRIDGQGCYTAVIDVGSGSARAVVMQVNMGGGIEIVAQQRVNLNLMSHVRENGVLDESGVASAVEALEDFAMVARGFGVQTIHAVGTAALRESENASSIIDAAVKRFGIPLRIIHGGDEAAFCFLGAIHGLPVTDGLLADIGGGSTEVAGFHRRTLDSSVSLPLGSLRIANQFNLTDLPTADDLHAAYEFVHTTLASAGVPRLASDEVLIGSGGSVRLLSRLDRWKKPYPIIKIHGYRVDADALAEQARQLACVSCADRASMEGMNPERVHSIVGGAIVAHALAQYANADGILVSGQGLREGLARRPDLLRDADPVRVPALGSIRAASLMDLVGRFVPRFSQRGLRRAAVAAAIGESIWRDTNGEIREALQCAAFLLDIGNAIDFYNRLNRTASIIVRTDLPGFTHRESAFMAAILLAAERGKLPRRFRRSRLLNTKDLETIRQAAAALVLAEELDNRLPYGRTADAVRFERQNGMLTVTTPAWSAAAGQGLPERWRSSFGEEIEIVRCES